MNAIAYKPERVRISARHMVKQVNFYCRAPRAKTVFHAGDFNGWCNYSLPLRRQRDGTWFLQVALSHGHHRYRFLVDGKPALDPDATGVTRDDFNEPVSLRAVS